MIIKISLLVGAIGYDYAMIRIWRNGKHHDYQYSSIKWNRLLHAMKQIAIWHSTIRPDGIDHICIIYRIV